MQIPTDKIDLTMYPRLTDSPSHTLSSSPLTSSHTPRTKRKNWRKSKKTESDNVNVDDHRWTGKGGKYVGGQSVYGGSGLVHGVSVGSGTQQPLWMKGADVKPVPVPVTGTCTLHILNIMCTRIVLSESLFKWIASFNVHLTHHTHQVPIT